MPRCPDRCDRPPRRATNPAPRSPSVRWDCSSSSPMLLVVIDICKVQISMNSAVQPRKRFLPGGGIRMPSRNGVQSNANGIEVQGLVREFKGGVRAVDGIDLEVRPGEIYGFLGPNGAGKSTTVHMLTTLLPPTAGSARV